MYTLSPINSVRLLYPVDHSPPGSSVHGILQARILEWLASPFSRRSSQPRDWIHVSYVSCISSWVGSDCKASAYNAGDLGSIPGLWRSPGEGNGNPLQYSCLENPMDGGAWWSAVHGVTKSWTWLSDFTFAFAFTFTYEAGAVQSLSTVYISSMLCVFVLILLEHKKHAFFSNMYIQDNWGMREREKKYCQCFC